jgi:hypothetical protein
MKIPRDFQDIFGDIQAELDLAITIWRIAQTLLLTYHRAVTGLKIEYKRNIKNC